MNFSEPKEERMQRTNETNLSSVVPLLHDQGTMRCGHGRSITEICRKPHQERSASDHELIGLTDSFRPSTAAQSFVTDCNFSSLQHLQSLIARAKISATLSFQAQLHIARRWDPRVILPWPSSKILRKILKSCSLNWLVLQMLAASTFWKQERRPHCVDTVSYRIWLSSLEVFFQIESKSNQHPLLWSLGI